MTILSRTTRGIMKTFFTVSMYILLTFGSLTAAEESIDLKKHLTTLDHVEFQSDRAFLCLNNGEVYSRSLLTCENEILKLWNAGDRIAIDIDVKNQGLLLLRNFDAKIMYVPQMTLEPGLEQNLLTIEKVEKVRNLKYPSIILYDYQILLSDGSFWKTDFIDDLLLWKEGNRIIISYIPDEEDDFDSENDFVTIINYDLVQTEKYKSSLDDFSPATPISLEKFPTIQKIEKRKEYEWSIAMSYYLTLSDKTCWKATLWNIKNEEKLDKWFVGDRLIIDDKNLSFIFITNYTHISKDMHADATVYFESVK